jgi:hypothetical protein
LTNHSIGQVRMWLFRAGASDLPAGTSMPEPGAKHELILARIEYPNGIQWSGVFATQIGMMDDPQGQMQLERYAQELSMTSSGALWLGEIAHLPKRYEPRGVNGPRRAWPSGRPRKGAQPVEA